MAQNLLVNQLDVPGIMQAAERTKAMRSENQLYKMKIADAQKPKPVDRADLQRALEWADTPQKFDQAIDIYVAEGHTEFERYRGQFDRRNEFSALLREESAGPMSGPGKVQADIEAGRLPKGTPLRGSGVTVNTGETIEGKLLDMDLQAVADTQEIVKATTDFEPKLETIVGGLESGNVETGRWQEATLPVRQWAQSMGWAEDPNLGQAELVQSAMAYMIPRMRVAGSGQTSDVEIRLFSDATAKFGNTTQGNILIARTLLQTSKRNKKVLSAQRAYLRENKNLDGFDADKTVGPIFPKPQSEEEYAEIRKGTVYIDTDGRFKVKK